MITTINDENVVNMIDRHIETEKKWWCENVWNRRFEMGERFDTDGNMVLKILALERLWSTLKFDR